MMPFYPPINTAGRKAIINKILKSFINIEQFEIVIIIDSFLTLTFNSKEELKEAVDNAIKNNKYLDHPSNWNISKITNISRLFENYKDVPWSLNNWDVSNVTNMNRLFANCKNFNQPLDKWDVSNVTNMNELFAGCTNFNQPLNNWDVSNVTNMDSLFYNCTNFNQPLNNWHFLP